MVFENNVEGLQSPSNPASDPSRSSEKSKSREKKPETHDCKDGSGKQHEGRMVIANNNRSFSFGFTFVEVLRY